MDLLTLTEKAFRRDLSDYHALEDAFGAVRLLEKEDFKTAHDWNKKIRHFSAKYAKERGSSAMFDINKRSLLFDAPYDFDAAFIYAEWNREPRKRFYLPRRKQLLPVVKALEELDSRKIKILGIMAPPGIGKALANDTPILTRRGWKNHGDLVVGDEVIGMDGNFKKVTLVHPKCQLDCLVELTNGEKIVCHENHEWMVRDRSGKHLTYIAETKRLEKRQFDTGGSKHCRGHRYNLQLPHRSYVVGEEKVLPLDPYTLGVWLGDGANKNPRICCAPKDRAIIDKIVANGTNIRWSSVHKTTGVLYFDFDIRKKLQRLGFCHSKEIRHKQIPEIYLTASVKQRLELLAGLIDTDGCLSANKYIFTTAEETLKDTFLELISTFGWRGSVLIHNPVTSSSGIVGRNVCYTISFTPDCKIPCVLERKRNTEGRKQRAIAITNIRRTKPREGNCITVEGDGMYLAGKTMIPTHNTTVGIMGLVMMGKKRPELSVLGASHSNSFLRGVYDEINRMIDPKGEYLWNDIFPNAPIVKTNAQDMRIDLGTKKRFETFEFSSVGSGNAGKVRASNVLYADDLVDGIESAMSRERMDKLWQQYHTDLRQRMIGDCVELLIQTPWSLHDPIDRLEIMYAGDPTAKFIHLPALDENDESNFDYPYGVGFTTNFYHQQRDIMDDASWRALYMTRPIEREGQLYPEQELRRYFELPDGEPDAIISVCDTKDRGVDYCVMPIAYQYGQDYYIEDVICDNSNPEVVETRLISKCLQHKIHMSRFESNSAGGKIAEKVQNEVRAKGGRTKITTKYTTANKETKIIMAEPFVKQHFLFKDGSVIKDDKEYRRFLNFVCSYTMAGRNKFDDCCDALAMLADYAQTFTASKVEVVSSPFWR